MVCYAGGFNTMIYILPIRAGKVGAMYKIREMEFRGMRGENIDYAYFILPHAHTVTLYFTSCAVKFKGMYYYTQLCNRIYVFLIQIEF